MAKAKIAWYWYAGGLVLLFIYLRRHLSAVVPPFLATAIGTPTGNASGKKSYLGQSGLPRGMRNNNPGNIRRSANEWKGKVSFSSSTDSEFEQFEDYTHGVRAFIKNLHTYYTRGWDTIAEIVGHWAPASENDTAGYIRFVQEKTGISGDTQISWRYDTVRRIVRAMAHMENGRDAVTDEDFKAGWLAAGFQA